MESFFSVCAKSSKSVCFILRTHLKFELATFQVLVATVLDSAIPKSENHLRAVFVFS